jgi:hypothetical protein
LVDYPTTKAEILAFSKYGQSINALFCIEEVAQVVEDDENDDEEDEATEAKKVKQRTPDNQEAQSQATKICEAFKSARAVSDAKSHLRNLAVIRIPFTNAEASYSV